MFKIGEFSKLTQVSVRMLRYYDEAGLLKPAHTDKFTGYRLYSPGQISELNKIIFLRDLGFNVAEMADALRHWGGAPLERRLDEKREEAEAAIRAGRERLSKIELAKRDILRERISDNYNVAVKAVPGCQVLSLRRVAPGYYAEGALWGELSAFAEENGVAVSGGAFAIYHDEEYKERNVDIEVCAPVAAMGVGNGKVSYRVTEPVPLMAYTMVCGDFENIAGAYLAFAGWLGEHNRYKMCGKSRQAVHRGPWNEECPDNYLTEIQIPLAEVLTLT